MNVILKCIKCESHFEISTNQYGSLKINTLPKKCPSCNDIEQKRKPWNTVINREIIKSFDGVKVCIPDEWWYPFKGRKNDRLCRRVTIKGNRGNGVSWSGRIDIFDFRENINSPGLVKYMMVEKQSYKPVEIREIDSEIESIEYDLKDKIKEEHELPLLLQKEYKNEALIRINELRQRKKEISKNIIDDSKDNSETYNYLVIENSSINPTRALIYARVDYKTTIKGYGNQYHANLNLSKSEWSIRLSSQCRSGRFGSLSTVAIVDNESYIVGEISGDINHKIIWNFDFPFGKEYDELIDNEIV